MKQTNSPVKVVIVGGGFGGINLIKKLKNDRRFSVTLVDKNNYNFFPPLLYQVATSFIEPSNISYPFRRLFKNFSNIRFHMGNLLRIDAAGNSIVTNTGKIDYDVLVIGTGTYTNYFGMENVAASALPMKTIDDALNMRNRLLLSMENAVRAADKKERDRHLNIVIAGGGPTGVEIAGMLAEMGASIAQKEYPEISNLGAHLYLVDAAPVLLSPMSKKSQDEAANVLKELGVHLILNNPVKDYINGQVLLADGTAIETDTLIWASGVTARKIEGINESCYVRGNRLLVDACNRLEGYNNIYAIGDCCYQTTDSAFPNGHPQLAQVAIQQGEMLGQNLKNIAADKPLQSFIYNDKGSMAIIAKYKAVVDFPKFTLRGFFAWCIWLFIHIIPLIGLRNRFKLAFNWFWAFLSNNPALRLIIRPETEKKNTLKGT